MGRLIKCSGDTVSRLLNPASISLTQSIKIAQLIFAKEKNLNVSIDDTLIKKIYSKMMQGAGMFYDTKIGRRIMAYRLVIGIISNGKFSIPIDCAYLFTKELLEATNLKTITKDEIAKKVVKTAIKLFPNIRITVSVDGLYSSAEFLRWCRKENIRLEARMHSNRVVLYKGKKIKIKDLLQIKGLEPKGRQMSRTIPIIWHDIDLELTIVRRIDKHDNESIVFQVSTYKALSREHVANYAKRWKVEMLNRTTKQKIGLQDCYSRDLTTQHNHASAVLLAYALMQVEMKIYRLDTTEQAIRHCEMRNVNFLKQRFTRFLQHNS
jgi:SRSO17 transposase